jgi:hypothetical protein
VHSSGKLLGEVQAEFEVIGDGRQWMASSGHCLNVGLNLVKVKSWFSIKGGQDEIRFFC